MDKITKTIDHARTRDDLRQAIAHSDALRSTMNKCCAGQQTAREQILNFNQQMQKLAAEIEDIRAQRETAEEAVSRADEEVAALRTKLELAEERVREAQKACLEAYLNMPDEASDYRLTPQSEPTTLDAAAAANLGPAEKTVSFSEGEDDIDELCGANTSLRSSNVLPAEIKTSTAAIPTRQSSRCRRTIHPNLAVPSIEHDFDEAEVSLVGGGGKGVKRGETYARRPKLRPARTLNPDQGYARGSGADSDDEDDNIIIVAKSIAEPKS